VSETPRGFAMKSWKALLAVFLGLAASGAPPAKACIVLPTPLWDVVGRSDVIALARVEGFERKPPRPGGCGGADPEMDVAVLKILDSWKGSPGRTLRLDFTGELMAGGRRVAEGDRILIFLESGESQVRRNREAGENEEYPRERVVEVEGDDVVTEPLSEQELFDILESERLWEESRIGRWFVADPAGGVLIARDEAIGPFGDVIGRAVRLQEAGPVSQEAVRAWLLQAIGVRSLRRRAIENLEAAAGYPRLRSGEPSSRRGGLTAEEQRTLAGIFTADPLADSTLPAIIGLLNGLEDEDFDRAVVSVIEAGVAAEKVPYWIPEAIREVIARRGWRDWGSALWHRYAAEGTLKDVWPAVARDLQLPAASPAALPIAEDD
jgi:hypothetical protein